MKKQQGFVLVSVLIITTITTMLAFSQINENRLQERMGGNQQKELNARLAAEKGLFEAFDTIKGLNLDGKSNEYIKDQLDKLSGDDYSFPSVGLSGNTFTLISKGEVNGAIAYLKTEIEAIESSGIFEDAVVGCESVMVTGSSNIDSFKGQSYADAEDDGTTKTNGDVTVINGYAVVDNAISGSVTVSGDGTAVTSKYVDSMGDVYLGNNVPVTGNIVASGSFEGREEDVGGDVTTGVSLDLGDCDPLDIANNMPTLPTSTTATLIDIDTDLPGNSLYFGKTEASTVEEEEEEEINYDASVAAAATTLVDAEEAKTDAEDAKTAAATALDSAKADADNASSLCSGENNANQIQRCIDDYDADYNEAVTDYNEAVTDYNEAVTAYNEAVTTYDDAVKAAEDTNTDSTENTDTNTESTETDTESTETDTDTAGDDTFGNLLTTNMYLFDDETTTPVYVFDSLDLTAKDVVISGDVTFYIKGDMITKNTIFTLDPDVSSSLTIFIEGNMVVDTGSEIFANEFVSGSDVPLTVYSSNDGSYMGNNGDTAVNLGGNADIYMNVYAPLGGVYYNGNGDIMGALRGQAVELSGTGNIHYDEGLGDIGGSDEAASASYSSVYYHYPKNE